MAKNYAVRAGAAHFDPSSLSVPWRGLFTGKGISGICRYAAGEPQETIQSHQGMVMPVNIELPPDARRVQVPLYRFRCRSLVFWLRCWVGDPNDKPNFAGSAKSVSGPSTRLVVI